MKAKSILLAFTVSLLQGMGASVSNAVDTKNPNSSLKKGNPELGRELDEATRKSVETRLAQVELPRLLKSSPGITRDTAEAEMKIVLQATPAIIDNFKKNDKTQEQAISAAAMTWLFLRGGAKPILRPDQKLEAKKIIEVAVSSYSITFGSEPTKAKLVVNGIEIGATDQEVYLYENKCHVTISKEGFEVLEKDIPSFDSGEKRTYKLVKKQDAPPVPKKQAG